MKGGWRFRIPNSMWTERFRQFLLFTSEGDCQRQFIFSSRSVCPVPRTPVVKFRQYLISINIFLLTLLEFYDFHGLHTMSLSEQFSFNFCPSPTLSGQEKLAPLHNWLYRQQYCPQVLRRQLNLPPPNPIQTYQNFHQWQHHFTDEPLSIGTFLSKILCFLVVIHVYQIAEIVKEVFISNEML